MALATQCPHCLTIFRVAGDQLKLRGGLVRCGSCRQVFNGEEFLVEASVTDGHYQPAPGSKARFGALPPAAPAVSPPSASSAVSIPEVNAPIVPVSPVSPVVPVASAPAAQAQAVTAAAFADPIPAEPEPRVFRSPASPGYIPDLGAPLKTGEQPDPEKDHPASTVPDADIDTAVLLRRSSVDDAMPVDEEGRPQPAPDDDDPFKSYEQALESADAKAERPERDADGNDADTEEVGKDEEDDEDEDEDPADEPAFVKRAERKERISHVMKMAMMILAGVMVPILLLQSTYYWRNQLAAAVPPLRPMLNGMCTAFHCSVGLPAEIERLTLESNELQVVPPNQNIYALSLVLRNRGAGAQAWPHIELTLNNDDEKAVVRRVFRPREYLPTPQLLDTGIAGESEQQVKLTFELNDALVSGYRIYLFYP
ncbi:DUF3426 domain-containing protein [Herbaspirillum robiniae]|uniref:DUF3426 domain-containing protein n=1 Tax=Herbaspirillum robiniae TaxID=2014887 RepID=A0ABX2LVJ3_9BURK|nr:DUF3426 domain-containing protein [Herbaspirillum robiniae]NUU02085.1 DUF3426 domain-containing protein [Herbaspirillum robiniae]